MKSIVSPSFLKQKSRQLKKEKSLSQNQALDEAAKQLGYSNYKNYLNVLKANCKQPKLYQEVLLKNIFSENDMSKKVDLAILFIQKFQAPFHDLLYIFKLFRNSAKDLQLVCGKSKLREDIKKYLFNDFLTDEGQGDIEDHCEYYRAKDLSITDITYEIYRNILRIDGMYDLTIEFNSEVPDGYKEYPHFQDRSLFGTFEITIEKNKKITTINSDIGGYGTVAKIKLFS